MTSAALPSELDRRLDDIVDAAGTFGGIYAMTARVHAPIDAAKGGCGDARACCRPKECPGLPRREENEEHAERHRRHAAEREEGERECDAEGARRQRLGASELEQREELEECRRSIEEHRDGDELREGERTGAREQE